MKKTKLLVSLLFVLLVTLVFVACSGSSSSTTQGTDTTTVPVGTDGNVTTVVGGTTSQPDLVTTPAVTTKKDNTPSTPTTLGATYGLPDEMPVIYIDTYGKNITSKEEYIPGLCSIDNVNEAFAMDEAEIEIRGRGNYSWSSTEKKSYRIKFAEKTNLLGQGNGPCRSWTLLAVHCDQSLLRTAAGFYFGRNLTGLDFISSATFAKVYLNGEYVGQADVPTFTYSATENYRNIVIGGDTYIGTPSKFQNPSECTVGVFRLYDNAMSDAEVKAAYERAVK